MILGRSDGHRNLVMDENEERLEATDIAEIWSDGVARTFERLAGASDAVALLVDTPWPGMQVPDCLSESIDEPTQCAFSLADGLRDLDLLEQESVPAAANDVVIVDLAESICPTDPCSVVTEEGLITYRDSHHLTVAFTLTLTDALAEEFGDIIDDAR